MAHHSQFGQDALVGDVLFKGRAGVFVDVGARDGVQISNTYHLERDLGWTGIAVEPHPDLFERLRASRSCECVNAAASDRARDDMEFVKFLEEPLGNSGLLSTFHRPDRLRSVRHEIVSVRTRALSEILSRVPLVHYLDIDVEGHEVEVLRGVDFGRTEIRIIGIEVSEASPKRPVVEDLLSAHAFFPFMQLGADRFFCHGSRVPSVDALCGLP